MSYSYFLCTIIIITQKVLYFLWRVYVLKKKKSSGSFPFFPSPVSFFPFSSWFFLSLPFPNNSVVKPSVGTEQGVHPQDGVQVQRGGPRALWGAGWQEVPEPDWVWEPSCKGRAYTVGAWLQPSRAVDQIGKYIKKNEKRFLNNREGSYKMEREKIRINLVVLD